MRGCGETSKGFEKMEISTVLVARGIWVGCSGADLCVLGLVGAAFPVACACAAALLTACVLEVWRSWDVGDVARLVEQFLRMDVDCEDRESIDVVFWTGAKGESCLVGNEGCRLNKVLPFARKFRGFNPRLSVALLG